MSLLWILLLTGFGGAFSALAAGALVLLPARLRTRVVPSLVSYAVGAMLAVVCLDLLPELFATDAPREALGGALLGGVLLFFLLEKAVLWRHAHPADALAGVHTATHTEHARGHGPRSHAAGPLILIGDSTHNFVDGVLIASAYLTDPALGFTMALAVFAHEVPQEVGNVVVLLNAGYTPARALGYNVLANLGTVVGGVGAALAFTAVQPLVPYVLAVAAASFIYIAVADLIPELHQHTQPRAALAQTGLIVLGVATVVLAQLALHDWVGH